MASTNFQDYNQNTPIVASWLNDVNAVTYSPGGIAKTAIQSAAALARFSVSGGVVTIQQSSNIASIVRSSQGIFVVTFTNPFTNTMNIYNVMLGQAGIGYWIAETPGSVTIETVNLAGGLLDPSAVSLTVFGAN